MIPKWILNVKDVETGTVSELGWTAAPSRSEAVADFVAGRAYAMTGLGNLYPCSVFLNWRGDWRGVGGLAVPGGYYWLTVVR